MMQFNFKRFLIFLVVFIGGSFAGGYVNSFLGLSGGTGIFGYFMGIFVPVLIIYLFWEHYGKKQA